MLSTSQLLVGAIAVIFGLIAYFSANTRARRAIAALKATDQKAQFNSQPNHHAAFSAGFVVFLTIGAYYLYQAFIGTSFLPGAAQNDGSPLFVVLATAVVAGAAAYSSQNFVRPSFRARHYVELAIKAVLIFCSTIAVLTTLGIILSLLFESLRIFEEVPILDFLTGLQWSPQTAMRADQVGQSGAFGAVPIFAGTFLVMAVAIFVSAPIGLMIAMYLSEYASKRTRAVVKPIIEVLAGIPTVVYGFFALLTVGPAIRAFSESLGFAVPTQSAIAAGSVMGIMIIPFISSLSDDVINAVPQSLRDGSCALGATKSETMMQVIFTGALPGIIGAMLLAISRAIGETMIVVMAAGRAANLTGNPFEAVTTVTVQIVALLTGDQEFDSPKTLAAFALGLVLFVITLALNMVALIVVRRYRERYE